MTSQRTPEAKKKRDKRRNTNPLYDGEAECKCVDGINAKLREHNTRLVTTLFTGKCAVWTEKVASAVRGKALTMLATYCPFCGIKYPEAKP